MTNSTDNADGVVTAGVVPPDLGPEASSGFQSQARTASRPYTRPKHRVTTMDRADFKPLSSKTKSRPPATLGRRTRQTTEFY